MRNEILTLYLISLEDHNLTLIFSSSSNLTHTHTHIYVISRTWWVYVLQYLDSEPAEYSESVIKADDDRVELISELS